MTLLVQHIDANGRDILIASDADASGTAALTERVEALSGAGAVVIDLSPLPYLGRSELGDLHEAAARLGHVGRVVHFVTRDDAVAAALPRDCPRWRTLRDALADV